MPETTARSPAAVLSKLAQPKRAKSCREGMIARAVEVGLLAVRDRKRPPNSERRLLGSSSLQVAW